MKKLIKISLIILILSSCEKVNVQVKETKYKVNEQNNLKEIIIDSCQYLYGDWGQATVLTHKGNCKNHKLNKQD
jgi:hypothetical protein